MKIWKFSRLENVDLFLGKNLLPGNLVLFKMKIKIDLFWGNIFFFNFFPAGKCSIKLLCDLKIRCLFCIENISSWQVKNRYFTGNPILWPVLIFSQKIVSVLLVLSLLGWKNTICSGNDLVTWKFFPFFRNSPWIARLPRRKTTIWG